MFIVGIIIILISVALIIGGYTARKKGDIRGSSVSVIGKAGIVIGIVIIVASGIRIIGPGEVGVIDLFGKVYDKELHSGVNLVNPLVNLNTFSIKTREMQETMNVPSQEGLQVDLDVSMLYKMKPDTASEIFKTIGVNFEDIIIRPSFRSAARNVSVRYDASAMYTASREEIAQSLSDEL